MCRDDDISSEVKRTQETIFRRSTATQKCLEMDTGLHRNTLGSYARGEAVMSVASLRKLLPHMEEDLLSMLLGNDFRIVRVPEGVCLDTLEEDFLDFVKMKAAAHHPDSEEGREISKNEKADLMNKVTKISEAV